MNAYADLTTLKSESYLSITATDHDTYLRRLLEDASRVIDNACKRFFYCDETTRYADGAAKKLWLPKDVLSITTLKTDDGGDGTFENTWTENTDFNLYPLDGFPKLYAQIGYNASYTSFANGIPRGVEIAGVFGFGDGKSATPYISTDTIGAAIINASQTTITLSDATSNAAGHTILIDDEQIYITSSIVNPITVKRGVNGTTAVAHSNGTTIYTYEYPMPITQACLITAMRAWKRKDSAFMDIVGTPETGTIPIIKGLDPDVEQRIKHYIKYLSVFA